MNNEIQRKITSLTLMTIMLAGGMSFAIPGMEPAFAANANLFVSAEKFSYVDSKGKTISPNYMSGPQVIEVIVIDSAIDETNEAKGEPDVEINGKTMRMVQAVDGNWYGYFADNAQVVVADRTTTIAGQGLDFGTICPVNNIDGIIGVPSSQAEGIAVRNAITKDNDGQCTQSTTTLNVTSFTGGAAAVAAVAGVAANNTVTVGTVVAGNTITIGGQLFTATATVQDANNFVVGTSPTLTAANLVTAITANTRDAVTAASTAAVITITAGTAGNAGNSIAITQTGGNITVPATLTGGVNEAQATAQVTVGTVAAGNTITIGGQLFSASPVLQDTNNFVVNSTDSTITAANLVTAITANTDDGVTAASTDAVITLTASTAGTAGNSIAITQTGGNITIPTATATVTVGTVVAGHTITIGGQTFTATATGGTQDANNFVVNSTDSTITATNLVTAITANADDGVTAASTDAVITLTASTADTAGNSIAITQTGGTITIPATLTNTLAGGVTGVNATAQVTVGTVAADNTITIGGQLFTATTTVQNANNFVVNSTNSTITAANLVTAITANTDDGVTAASTDAVITLTASTAGTAGNSIAISSTGGTITVPATLTGGVSEVTPVPAQASTSTVTVGTVVAGHTITIGGQTFTATATGGTQDANNFVVNSTDSTITAANLVTAITANADDGVTATSTDAVITLTASTEGTAGNSIAISTNSITITQNVDVGVIMNVLRETKDLNLSLPDVAGKGGQIGITANLWPFIQLYDLSPGGNVKVQYNKGGGAQLTTLTFDTVRQFADIKLDESRYTRDAQVHATITDLWLNIDPTDEDSWTFGTNSTHGLSTHYQVFTESGALAGAATANGIIDISESLSSLMSEDNGILIVNADAQGKGQPVLRLQGNGDSSLNCPSVQDLSTCSVPSTVAQTELRVGSQPITVTESEPNSGIFGTYDDSDESVIKITAAANRGTSATIEYIDAQTILTGFFIATIELQATDDEWNSGETIPVVLDDGDLNKNSRSDEDLDLYNPDVLIPAISTGYPFTLGEAGVETDSIAQAVYGVYVANTTLSADNTVDATIIVEKYSERAIINSADTTTGVDSIIIDYESSGADLKDTILDNTGTLHGFNFLNLDVRGLDSNGPYSVWLLNSTANDIIIDDTSAIGEHTAILLALNVTAQSLTELDDATVNKIQLIGDTDSIGITIKDTNSVAALNSTADAIVVDFFSFGFINDGLEAKDRIANQIIRLELEETTDNSGIFTGTLEYVMLNQINILDPSTYSGLSTIADDPTFIVIEDLTDEDSPRINYFDLGSDGVSTQIADQEEAPSHSGVVSFDDTSYKTADTVTIKLVDLDLNVDSDLIDIYTTVNNAGDNNQDAVGIGNSTSGGFSIQLNNGQHLGRLLDVTFDDKKWTATNTCNLGSGIDSGLAASGFTLVETKKSSGIFTGSFQIPSQWCNPSSSDKNNSESPTGLDLEVNYVDFRDASGEVIEVGDSAGIRANTGSVSLDRTVYPVPFGVPDDFESSTQSIPSGRAIFPIHQSSADSTLGAGEYIANGDLIIHVRVNDPDFDLSASGEDSINANSTATKVGPVKISVIRGSSSVILGYAGGPSALTGTIDTDGKNLTGVRALGPMNEISPDAGIFEADITIRYTDGPASTTCPSITDEWVALDGQSTKTEQNRFDIAAETGDYCILQGDILQVEYSDPTDSSGNLNTVTDSATFDLRNGVLQTDKSVYIIGSDMILTLIEPDFDLDNDQAETYNLDLIEWDSDAATITMGSVGDTKAAFDPEPSNFRETGDSTGIFQIVIEIPSELKGDGLERGEQIDLEYTDWGPSGSNYVGDEDEDINVTVFTSNFGATVELDQKVYTWTDKVYITIVAPDHNFDTDLVDEIGNSSHDPIKVTTRGYDIDGYKLVETGTDTGIFTGEVILTGFSHDADGDTTTGTSGNDVTFRSASGAGPTNGLLPADNDDGLTVSFEFSEDETVVGSALIRWNIGDVQWLESSYPASGTGITRVIDPDMNLNPEAVDNFSVDVWSDSDAGGIDLIVTETNEATGIFEGTVFFTITDESSGHRLRVAEGDTVTVEYEDNTLPGPYTTADELDVTATTLIGTVVPPLERAQAANLRVVDAFGNSLNAVTVDQQVQISADLASGQDREQNFAYLVQIQNGDGVTVSLAWITGSLASGQSFSPALSWVPTTSGSYTATAFVWESVDNPTALSPPVSTTIDVS